jgi:hypothetical protein
MKRFGTVPILHGVTALLALATVAVLVWPAPPEAEGATPTAVRFSGDLHKLRSTQPGAMPSAIRLTGGLEAASSQSSPTSAGAPALVGLIGRRQAYLRNALSGEVERLTPGDELDGWTLVSIGTNQVALERSGQRRVLELFNRTPDTNSSDSAALPAPTRVPPQSPTMTPPAPQTPQ